jgi:ligand-binding sensor domain-containing protein
MVQVYFNFALDPDKRITQYIHDSWQTKEGLPHNCVFAIVQTGNGYIWLGTADGLVRFDGVRFTIFNKGNTEEIKDNRIFALFLERGDI